MSTAIELPHAKRSLANGLDVVVHEDRRVPIVAVNLAIALSKCGARVGLIDADIYGPNVPIMLGLQTQLTSDGEKILPAEKYGLQVI